MVPQKTDLDLPVSLPESPVEAWLDGGLVQGWGSACSSACTGRFEGGHHYLPYLHASFLSGQTTGRENSPIHQQKSDYRFTEHGPGHQNKTQFPPQSVSHIRKLTEASCSYERADT